MRLSKHIQDIVFELAHLDGTVGQLNQLQLCHLLKLVLLVLELFFEPFECFLAEALLILVVLALLDELIFLCFKFIALLLEHLNSLFLLVYDLAAAIQLFLDLLSVLNIFVVAQSLIFGPHLDFILLMLMQFFSSTADFIELTFP